MGGGCSFSYNFATLFIKYQIWKVGKKAGERRIIDKIRLSKEGSKKVTIRWLKNS